MPGGAIVAADAPRSSGELVAVSGLDFRVELRKLSSEYRSQSREQREAERQQMEILQAAETQLLAESDAMAVFTDVPVKETFHRGQTHAASARLQLEWFPPGAELAQACSLLVFSWRCLCLSKDVNC